MAFESTGKNLCALDAEVNSAVLNSGNGGLRNTCEFGELTLAQLLKLAQNTDGFTDRNFNSLFGGTIVFHIRVSDNRGR